MKNVIVYYAHPGHKHSHVNKAMMAKGQTVEGISLVDLYAEYPRHNINIEREQQRLLDHDVIVFQFPLFWYSTPSLIKEWLDLVLEFGFAYGPGGDKLAGKAMLLAISTGGPEEAYQPEGYQHHHLHTFLSPLEQTARLCQMSYLPPYVQHAALRAPDEGRVEPHAEGYRRLLEALRDDSLDLENADAHTRLYHDTLPIREEAAQ